ncbi:ABC transporter permease [Agrobacterium vitis]|uniref:ABC transporter permease n=1 Tax=Agrobacterium vitis TaxID=373 RepID=A0ABD6G9T7_AGRVI|nr:ABC transporter permease [Agrobacterium vitis]MUO94456.1 ABC transporter permease [Agrobacterium vitis]MUP06115.1 ABC transporter permease [Agrobacterium vitis]MUZ82212.1 ABC transporter permease [Agrobacterium vitis]MVA11427.1 ABC transporter permease [Agrobacterium vitis]
MKIRSMSSFLKPQFAALIAVLLLNWMVFPGFFDIAWRDGRLFGSLIDVLNRGAPVAILAIGMTAIIATRGVDLSVGAVMAVAGAVAATCAVAGQPLVVTLAAALAVALACGIWNGLLVAYLGIQPFVATLVLMVAGRGLAQLVTSGSIVTFSDPALIFVGTGSLLGFPMPVVIAVVLMLSAHIFMRRTAIGLFIEAIGTNLSAANYTGLRSRALILGVYAFGGLCAGIAGTIAAADIRGADANNAGLWLELDAILAVVIGGTSLLGGRFSIPMSVLGAVIIQAMNTGILVSGLPPEFNLIVKASVIIIILVLQSDRVSELVSFWKHRPAVLPKNTQAKIQASEKTG